MSLRMVLVPKEKRCGRMITSTLMLIAICEIIKTIQNFMQLRMIESDTSARDNAYAEFVKSLKTTDKEFVERMLKEFNDMKEYTK